MSSITNNIITPGMVKSFTVGSTCHETLPCQHDCIIVLSDGRKKNVCLSAPEIHELAGAIALEKITPKDGRFCSYKHPSGKKLEAEKILTETFSEHEKIVFTEKGFTLLR
jgi:hypothetical protein